MNTRVDIRWFVVSVGLSLAAGVAGSGYAAEGEKTKEEKSKEEKPKEEKPKKEPKDMSADEAEAAGLCAVCKNEHKQVFHSEVGGKMYHFATRKCQKEFSADPAKFGVKADKKPEIKTLTQKTEAAKTGEEKDEEALDAMKVME